MLDRLRLTAAALAAAVLIAIAPVHATASNGLRAIQAITAARHADIEQFPPGDVAALIEEAPQRLLLLDVREADEYAVSHLRGAIRVSPGLSAQAFQRRFASRLAGRKVVLYCSVGVRSSELASRIKSAAGVAGATAVANLEGGIFAWHNAKRPLVDASGTTDLIHPYNRYWGMLIERDALISYANSPRRANPSSETTGH